MAANTGPTPEDFVTFGELLKYLRRHRKLTQLDLALAVGYSESQISHLEQNQRAPSKSINSDRFMQALGLEREGVWAARSIELAFPVRALESSGLRTDSRLAGTHNVPVHGTSFVGRQNELAVIVQHFANSERNVSARRLVTLTGAGGSGKTRLAAEATSLLVNEFPQGIWWVDLGSLSKPSLVPQTVASVFGIKDRSSRPMVRTLPDFLRTANLLLILDNCEHLITASATLIEAILRDCPRVKFLVTSLQVLNLSGEVTFHVPSLSTPAAHTVPTVITMPRYDAVRLFVDRAAAVSPTFVLSEENATDVVQVCQRLDGIPLAIELAAARLRMLSVRQIARGLDDRFRLLTGGAPDRAAAPSDLAGAGGLEL